MSLLFYCPNIAFQGLVNISNTQIQYFWDIQNLSLNVNIFNTNWPGKNELCILEIFSGKLIQFFVNNINLCYLTYLRKSFWKYNEKFWKIHFWVWFTQCNNILTKAYVFSKRSHVNKSTKKCENTLNWKRFKALTSQQFQHKIG